MCDDITISTSIFLEISKNICHNIKHVTISTTIFLEISKIISVNISTTIFVQDVNKNI